MSSNAVATATARRNLAHRIGAFIARIGHDGYQPDVDAMANLVIALEALERDDYPTGEDAMMLAEYGWAPRQPRTAEPRPISELMAHFERLSGIE